MRDRRSLRLAAALILAALSPLTACLPPEIALPDREPDIRGEISELRPIDGSPDTIGTFVVRGSGNYDYALVIMREDTKLLFDPGDSTARSIGAVEITDGDTVEVWFEGPVAESYPVQGTAAAIVVLGEAR